MLILYEYSSMLIGISATSGPAPWYISWLWLLILAACILGFLFVCCWFIVFCRWCYNRKKRNRRRSASSTQQLTGSHAPDYFPHVRIPTYRTESPWNTAWNTASPWKRWQKESFVDAYTTLLDAYTTYNITSHFY